MLIQHGKLRLQPTRKNPLREKIKAKKATSFLKVQIRKGLLSK